MTHLFWSEPWTAALVNHLWQSTLFVLIAWLVTLTLRNYQARIRYWIWMIASVKFLIPFSILIYSGEYLRMLLGAHIQNSTLTAAMERIGQQRLLQTSSAAIMMFNSDKAPTMSDGSTNPFALLLPALWLCGFLAVMIWWVKNWIQIRHAVYTSSQVGIFAKVPVHTSSQLLEPAVFGIFRPVLLLPEAIKNRCSASQVDAIVAHEMCHVGRRDNLTMAIHMIVQSGFWFHPAVWWIKARLIDERERACDEAVLQSGAQAQLYADSILIICRLCIESPLACASGVGGSDLKRRIVRIMTGQIARKLGFSGKLFLSIVGIVALAIPVALGLGHIVQAHAQVAMESRNGNISVKNSLSITASDSEPDGAPTPHKEYVPTMTFDVASVRESDRGPNGSFLSGDFSPPNSSHVRLMNYPLAFPKISK